LNVSGPPSSGGEQTGGASGNWEFQKVIDGQFTAHLVGNNNLKQLIKIII